MKKGMIMISLLLALLLVFGSATIAQSEPWPVFCGDLAQADCDLLKETQEATTSLTSGSAEIEMSMAISNIPDMPMDELAFRVTGNATYSVDPMLLDSIKGLQGDPAALFSSPDSFAQWMSDILKGVSGDLNLTLELPSELVAMMGTDPAMPETLSIGLRLVDGFGYVNLEDIAAAMPDADVPSGWIGADLASLMEMMMQQSEFADAMSVDPSAFQDYMMGLQDPAIMGEFMTIERVDDTEVMGQSVAVFRTTFDYAAFFRSDIFQKMMRAQIATASAMTGEAMSDSDIAEMEAMMSQMGSMFEDISLEIVQVIGLEDKYIHTTEMHMDWDMAGFMMMVEPDMEGPAPGFTFDMAIHNSNFNDAPPINAPEDATIFPLEAMLSSSDQ